MCHIHADDISAFSCHICLINKIYTTATANTTTAVPQTKPSSDDDPRVRPKHHYRKPKAPQQALLVLHYSTGIPGAPSE